MGIFFILFRKLYDNGYIYDLEFNYLIGQIKIENNHFVKDKNVFIINMLVPY